MLRNLVKIAFRNLLKDKAYSAINILGLTIGITCSMFLLMYIMDELSYDRYHVNAKNIYRIVSNIKEPDDAFTWAVTQRPMGVELRDNYPEIVNTVRFDATDRRRYRNGDLQFYEDQFYLADSTAFDMFTYKFIAGDPSTALDNPFSLVLTERTAKKYFDDPAEALNQSLQTDDNETFKITGIIEDVPVNSHFRFDGLMASSTRAQFQGSWGNFGTRTYIQLPDNYDLDRMYANLDKIINEKVNPIFDQFGIKVKYELQPLLDIHLRSRIADEAESGGDMSYIIIFSAVAGLMIFIACINYMNLATARSAGRAKEVGLRKVMGSARKQLIAQFLTESVVVTLIAMVLSLLVIYVALPGFNTLANKQLYFGYVFQPQVLAGLLAIIFITGIVGGSYPAFYLSGFSPVAILKGKLASKGGSAIFRKVLVVLQFGLTIFMLISTLIVFDQLQFLREKDLGFDKENVVRFTIDPGAPGSQRDVLVNQLRKLPIVMAVGRADASPGEGIGKAVFKVEDAEGKMVDRGVDLYGADYDFIDALGMKIVAGRNFSKDNPADSAFAVLVNESMVTRMGWKDPLGKKFSTGDGDGDFNRQVIGVVKDYNQNSLYNPIEPLMIVLNNRPRNFFVRLAPGDPRKAVESIEAEWKQMFPSQPFQYQFLDADLDSQYQADQKRSQIFTAFSGLTIVIACLGLLGLAAYTTEQRTKEIGVRKVIGASVNGLVLLVSREFFVLVGIGMLLAFPAAWIITDRWLQNFAFRVELGDEWMTFVVSAVLAMVITMLTVGYHVVRAALANPVNALRDE
jgi:putative ABC transport system permease protein